MDRSTATATARATSHPGSTATGTASSAAPTTAIPIIHRRALGQALRLVLRAHAEKRGRAIDRVDNRLEEAAPLKLVGRYFPVNSLRFVSQINLCIITINLVTHRTGVVAPEPPRDEQVFALGAIMPEPPLQQLLFVPLTTVVSVLPMVPPAAPQRSTLGDELEAASSKSLLLLLGVAWLTSHASTTCRVAFRMM